MPFGGEKAIKSFNDMVGIKTNSPIIAPKRSLLRNLHLVLIILPKFLSYYLRTHKYHQEYKFSFKELHQLIKARSPGAKSALEIVALLQEYDFKYLDLIKIPLFNDFFSSILNHACHSLAISIAGTQGERIYNDLLSHREDLESLKAIYSLIDLAQTVAQNPKLLDFLSSHKGDMNILKSLSEHFPDFQIKLHQHFERFGDRSQWEMKVEVPTAREIPETTIKLIINYAQSGLSQQDQRNREREKASKATSELNSYFKLKPIKFLFFKLLFRKCTEALCFREDARFDRVRYKGLSRSLLLRLGDVMVCKSLLDKSEDLFFLTWEEVLSLQHDSFGEDYIKNLVALRKRHLSNLKDLSLPDRIVVNDFAHVEKFNQTKTASTSNHLFGIPCSGGKVEAECVVVHDLNEAPSLNGKILIARRTDPAWGYFFVGVKGIIIEKGSMLSHAAIISRELGIPCIINVANATEIFKSGTVLSMDGSSGEIKTVR